MSLASDAGRLTPERPIAITCGDPAGIGPDLVLTLLPANHLLGIVRDETGSPVRDFEVTALLVLDDVQQVPRPVRGRTDAEGRFVVGELFQRSYHLEFERRDGEPQRFGPLPAWKRGKRLVLNE